MEPRNGWYPFPEFKPAPDANSRHLCVIVQGDMHYVGVASWVPHRGGWWQGSGTIDGFVWAFQPLPQGYPIPPNSAEQLRLGLHGVTHEPLNKAASNAVAAWWAETRGWNNGSAEPVKQHFSKGGE